MHQVSAARTAGVGGNRNLLPPQTLQFSHELRVEPVPEKVARAFLQDREQEGPVHERHRGRALSLRLPLGKFGKCTQLLYRSQRVQVAVAHWHLTPRVTRIDDEQIVVRVAQSRGT